MDTVRLTGVEPEVVVMVKKSPSEIAGRFVKPWRAAATGHNFQAGFTWDNVKHFKDHHSIPLILKGIATAEDAALACEHGVDCVYVSNHGGRQLDHGRGAMDVLPEVLAAVRGRAKVMIDGSFCRGTDIVKAIALGADAVAMGRMYCYALAAEGDAGVASMLGLLEHEIGVAMALSGARSLAELNRSLPAYRRAASVSAARAQRVSAAVRHAGTRRRGRRPVSRRLGQKGDGTNSVRQEMPAISCPLWPTLPRRRVLCAARGYSFGAGTGLAQGRRRRPQATASRGTGRAQHGSQQESPTHVHQHRRLYLVMAGRSGFVRVCRQRHGKRRGRIRGQPDAMAGRHRQPGDGARDNSRARRQARPTPSPARPMRTARPMASAPSPPPSCLGFANRAAERRQLHPVGSVPSGERYCRGTERRVGDQQQHVQW